jgi:predicted nucleotidyltransferase
VAGQADGGIDAGRDALLRTLCEGGVRFVLIGGAAIESHGQPYSTQDVD